MPKGTAISKIFADGLVCPDTFEYGHAIVERMRQKVELRIAPLHQFTV